MEKIKNLRINNRFKAAFLTGLMALTFTGCTKRTSEVDETPKEPYSYQQELGLSDVFKSINTSKTVADELFNQPYGDTGLTYLEMNDLLAEQLRIIKMCENVDFSQTESIDKNISYTVVSGDDLKSIAARMTREFFDGSDEHEITWEDLSDGFEDPNMIFVGQIINYSLNDYLGNFESARNYYKIVSDSEFTEGFRNKFLKLLKFDVENATSFVNKHYYNYLSNIIGLYVKTVIVDKAVTHGTELNTAMDSLSIESDASLNPVVSVDDKVYTLTGILDDLITYLNSLKSNNMNVDSIIEGFCMLRDSIGSEEHGVTENKSVFKKTYSIN